ncbi:TPA: hypothetical protein QHT56_000873 [Enterobacter hormaechei subsp. steigerwaltii]|nr:hypothetical protein [Enterobacter hormaechei subsp. steigerwaltii]
MIFNGEMVRAILDGRKTQTRRVMKNQPAGDCPDTPALIRSVDGGFQWYGHYGESSIFNCPFGAVGDRIWVRETWGVVSHELDEDGRIQPWSPDRPATAIHEMPFGNGYYSGHAIYAADGEFTWGDDDGYEDGRSCWKPSIHMPRAASRITLEITDVWVERLASVSDEDAGKEGYPANPAPYGGSMDKWLWFRQLWDGIYPEQSFKHNPWVWVIEFKVAPNVQDNPSR